MPIGRIYKLTCNDPELIYYGSTFQSLKTRLSNHRADHKQDRLCSSKILFDCGDVEIHLEEEGEFDNVKEMENREGEYVKENKCVNIYIPGRTHKEWYEDNPNWSKEYYQKNRDKIIENCKKYYQKNKEEILEKKRENYKQNREDIRQKQSEKIMCSCGKIIGKQHRRRHEKTKYHIDNS